MRASPGRDTSFYVTTRFATQQQRMAAQMAKAELS